MCEYVRMCVCALAFVGNVGVCMCMHVCMHMCASRMCIHSAINYSVTSTDICRILAQHDYQT